MHSQMTVSTYLYQPYVTQKDTKPERSIWMWISTIFDIGHSLFDIRRKVGYLLDIQNIGHSKFYIQILMK